MIENLIEIDLERAYFQPIDSFKWKIGRLQLSSLTFSSSYRPVVNLNL